MFFGNIQIYLDVGGISSKNRAFFGLVLEDTGRHPVIEDLPQLDGLQRVFSSCLPWTKYWYNDCAHILHRNLGGGFKHVFICFFLPRPCEMIQFDWRIFLNGLKAPTQTKWTLLFFSDALFFFQINHKNPPIPKNHPWDWYIYLLIYTIRLNHSCRYIYRSSHGWYGIHLEKSTSKSTKI